MSENNSNPNGSNGNGHKPNGHKSRRTYSDRQKAEALAILDANEGNLKATERATGIPDSTLAAWAEGRAISSDVPELRDGKKEDLAGELEQWAWQLLRLNREPAEARKARYQERSNGIGIAIEKSRLLREQPTQITASADGAFAEMVKEYASKFNLTIPEAKARISSNLTNPAAIKALDAAFPPLASEEKQ